MADKLENTARRVASAIWAFLLFSKVFVEQGRGRVGLAPLQLIMAFMCSTFPSGQLLLVREGQGFFFLAEFLPCSPRDHVLFGCLSPVLMCL